jgi:hypothetical protein
MLKHWSIFRIIVRKDLFDMALDFKKMRMEGKCFIGSDVFGKKRTRKETQFDEDRMTLGRDGSLEVVPCGIGIVKINCIGEELGEGFRWLSQSA